MKPYPLNTSSNAPCDLTHHTCVPLFCFSPHAQTLHFQFLKCICYKHQHPTNKQSREHGIGTETGCPTLQEDGKLACISTDIIISMWTSYFLLILTRCDVKGRAPNNDFSATQKLAYRVPTAGTAHSSGYCSLAGRQDEVHWLPAIASAPVSDWRQAFVCAKEHAGRNLKDIRPAEPGHCL